MRSEESDDGKCYDNVGTFRKAQLLCAAEFVAQAPNKNIIAKDGCIVLAAVHALVADPAINEGHLRERHLVVDDVRPSLEEGRQLTLSPLYE